MWFYRYDFIIFSYKIMKKYINLIFLMKFFEIIFVMVGTNKSNKIDKTKK